MSKSSRKACIVCLGKGVLAECTLQWVAQLVDSMRLDRMFLLAAGKINYSSCIVCRVSVYCSIVMGH